ncbi:MAG: murein biosynthesis integral membrane protein MurJ [Proteobacteria bacterium]|nr:murein biosynthesis integral membrane protein MurJ [Pseudomonadota bacterium]
MSIARSSLFFSAGTFLSRISGLIRDSVVSAVFGASVFLDAYNVANRIPNLLRELLAEGALGASFTKVYSQLSVTDEERAKKLLIDTIRLVTIISIAIVSLGIIFAKPLVFLTTSSKRPEDLELLRITATGLTQVIFPFIGFISLGAIFQSVLYQRNRFFLVAVSPILFNLSNILGALYFGKGIQHLLPPEWQSHFGNASIMGLAVGTTLGGMIQAGSQLAAIWSPALSELKFWPRKFPWSIDTKKVALLMAPMVIAASAGQINFVVNINFSTSLQTGATTWLSNGFRMLQFPIGMFGVAIGAAVLPALSKTLAKTQGEFNTEANAQLKGAIELVLWLMVPCSLVLYFSSIDISRLLFQAGKYSANDAFQTGLTLRSYSLGLIGYGIGKVLNSYYYAIGRTKWPMIIGLISIGVNYGLNSYFIDIYQHQGIAMTASILTSFSAVLMLLGTRRDGFRFESKFVSSGILPLLLATAICVSGRILYEPLLSTFEVSANFALPHTLSVKIDSAARLVIDLLFISAIFISIGLLKLKKSPKEALAMLRRRP